MSEATTDSPIAYRLYEEGLRAYYQYDVAAAKRLMEAALAEDSLFAMAAYYFARLSLGDSAGTVAGQRALRLAKRAPEFQRLIITGNLTHELNDPVAVFVADSLAARFPNDPRMHELTARVRHWSGDFSGAVAAAERAIALDSLSEPVEHQACRLCDDLVLLSGIYQWWDSLDAADRTARRLLRLRPRRHSSWDILFRNAAARGDTTAFRETFERFYESAPGNMPLAYRLRYRVLAEQYDQAEAALRELATSPRHWEGVEARWLLSIAMRNEGRLSEALALSQVQPGPNYVAEALVEMERGNARRAVEIFERLNRSSESIWAPAVQARNHTWEKTLLSMALAAAGDTLRVRRMIDSVAFWGSKSAYGRDQRLHHYVRGLMFIAERRPVEAAQSFTLAVNSPTHGFTRINYELGRVLLQLGRANEAIPVIRAALHGDLDGSNLYMTRTDLHELLAKAFDAAGQRDSAVFHNRKVERAWARADPVYHARRDSVRAWLARNGQRAGNAMSASGTGRQLDQR